MSLSVTLNHRQGDFDLDVDFRSTGRLTALFGPSGSGKSTIVNLIAGLARPKQGRIEIGSTVLVDTAHGIFVPVHKRRIGYVFQDSRLFPHLTVSQNLRYGRWFTSSSDRYADFGGVIDMLGIGHLLDRRPGMLSGGEKSRVALGRALLASPRLILMDEPFAALDDGRKAEIFPYIERLRDESEIPIVYVSHSVAEVARLATDVVILSEGHVAASGPAAEVLSQPSVMPPSERDEAGALIELVMVKPDDGYGLSLLRASGGDFRLPAVDAGPGARLRVRVRARDVTLARSKPQDVSALNILPGTIASIAHAGPTEALVTIRCGDDLIPARITRRSLDQLGLAEGDTIYAMVKSVTIERAQAAPRA
ncbi:MAG: molybdenum ABC transporter ATP-binding protein [Mesorhizobium sp.]